LNLRTITSDSLDSAAQVRAKNLAEIADDRDGIYRRSIAELAASKVAASTAPNQAAAAKEMIGSSVERLQISDRYNLWRLCGLLRILDILTWKDECHRGRAQRPADAHLDS
jgi:hypothetical protein